MGRPWLMVLSLLVALWPAGPVAAQGMPAAVAQAEEKAAEPAVDPELKALIDKLEDPDQRARLIEDLKSLSALKKAQAPVRPAENLEVAVTTFWSWVNELPPVKMSPDERWRALAGSGIGLLLGVFLWWLHAKANRLGRRLCQRLAERWPSTAGVLDKVLMHIRRPLHAIIAVLTVLAVLHPWGFTVVDWARTPLGQRLLGGTVTIGLTLFIAYLLWSAIDEGVRRYLAETDAEGNTVERSSRARTLLPLARNAVFFLLVLVVGMVVLSELGMDIGPLLAGAGVIGLAIGFGAQKLVQDVITGGFMLIEDTVSVGDIVNVGGYSGVVEAMTVRTLKLRDLAGNVHTIPFSTVGTVTNMTKDFSYYVFDIGVAYREDTDEVAQVLIEVADDVRADPKFKAFILEPLEVLGVDAFGDSAVVVKARLKTRPTRQWMVGREMNRRIKKAFDARGIEIPFPHTTLYFGQDKQGAAPPLHLMAEQAARRQAAASGLETLVPEPVQVPEPANPTSPTPDPGPGDISGGRG
ncbi:mechanosensitive ion channel family protein [Roseospirillum parvum]|uniref:Small-conductance mechanosensitive channel n=1 Tax=Roseospirillum parvum TaxID=83401 RepID=A0A1G8BS60_9PROT|nr:mechanosensitive ion channel family protein [Roseospirillum parvum]SDH36055.1 Small-conductance mechanosensitive channel [Roseospirillum parvum]